VQNNGVRLTIQELNHMATYLDTTKYRELVQALLTGSMDENDKENSIKIALGELADIWPREIKPKPVIIGLSI
jgi:hypothetical protein